MALPAGDTLFREGEAGDFAYILEEGEVNIETTIDQQRVVLSTLKPGCLFGELALIDGRVRSADAIAKTDAILTLITPEQVAQRLDSADPVVRLLLISVAQYLRSETMRSRPLIPPPPLRLGTETPDRLQDRTVHAVDLIRMESELQDALAHGHLYLLYQPIIKLSTGQVEGFEALIRWHHPTRGHVPPSIFMPLAELTSLIVPIGEWVIQEGCRALHQMQTASGHHLFMSFNIASRQIEEESFMPYVLETIQAAQIDPAQIKLEILERSLFDNIKTLEWTQVCRQQRLLLALDDFGTGYSSLGYLNDYEFDTLKIDKSFIDRVDQDARCRSICQSIIHLARDLGMSTVAEGIERATQADVLHELGCTSGQGYLFARAVPLETAIQILDTAVGWRPETAAPSAPGNPP